jgi:predicted transcriptional regulator of viral defense system
MKAADFFYEHPIFRQDEFLEEVGARVLPYYLKTDRLLSIRRGLYAVIPPNQTAETLMLDSYLVAGNAAPDAVLAYHSALELHGVAYSVFGQLTYLTAQKNKPFEFQGSWFQAIRFPQALKNYPDFCIETIDRQRVKIKMTNLSRTFVDVLDRVELSGGWEEVCRSIRKIVVLNIEEVIQYCLQLGNASLAAKVGYFLEQREGAFAVSSEQLKPLLAAKPKGPQYVSRNSHEKCQLIKKWNLLMPISVINQSWEEPHVQI